MFLLPEIRSGSQREEFLVSLSIRRRFFAWCQAESAAPRRFRRDWNFAPHDESQSKNLTPAVPAGTQFFCHKKAHKKNCVFSASRLVVSSLKELR
jgi:hypothetical protein